MQGGAHGFGGGVHGAAHEALGLAHPDQQGREVEGFASNRVGLLFGDAFGTAARVIERRAGVEAGGTGGIDGIESQGGVPGDQKRFREALVFEPARGGHHAGVVAFGEDDAAAGGAGPFLQAVEKIAHLIPQKPAVLPQSGDVVANGFQTRRERDGEQQPGGVP